MALRNAGVMFKTLPKIKSEMIIDKLRGTNITKLVNKYQHILNQLNSVGASESKELLNFPVRTFNLLPTGTLKSLIKESHDFFQQKNLLDNIDLYNILIKSYIRNSVEFDVEGILRNINEKNIKFNELTYKLLIEYYCSMGSMEPVEILVQKMKSENLNIDLDSIQHMMSGYIIARQIDKSKAVIIENNLDPNEIEILISQAKGFAVLGDVEKVKQVIDRIKNEESDTKTHIYLMFYRLLATANVPLTDLKWILELVDKNEVNTRAVTDTIFQLNRVGLFNASLELVEYFRSKLIERNPATNLLRSFNSPDCPSNLYKYALGLLLDFSRVQQNLFYTMSYDQALKISNELINLFNCQSLFSSLFNKAISMENKKLIEKTLDFGIKNLQIDRFNSVLQYYLIPSLLHSGIVKDCREILKIQPKHELNILPSVLMYCLSKGQFSLYNEIRDNYQSYTNLSYSVNAKLIATSLLENLNFHEIDKFVEEAYKSFQVAVVNKVLAKLVVEKIIQSSQSNNVESIVESVNLSQRHKVIFKLDDINRMKTEAANHIKIFSPLLQMVYVPRTNFNPHKNVNNSKVEPKD